MGSNRVGARGPHRKAPPQSHVLPTLSLPARPSSLLFMDVQALDNPRCHTCQSLPQFCMCGVDTAPPFTIVTQNPKEPQRTYSSVTCMKGTELAAQSRLDSAGVRTNIARFQP